MPEQTWASDSDFDAGSYTQMRADNGDLKLGKNQPSSYDVTLYWEHRKDDGGDFVDSHTRDWHVNGSLIDDSEYTTGSTSFQQVGSKTIDVTTTSDSLSAEAQSGVTGGDVNVHKARTRVIDSEGNTLFSVQSEDEDGDSSTPDWDTGSGSQDYTYLYDYYDNGSWVSETRTLATTSEFDHLDVSATLNEETVDVTVKDGNGNSTTVTLNGGSESFDLAGTGLEKSSSVSVEVAVDNSGDTSDTARIHSLSVAVVEWPVAPYDLAVTGHTNDGVELAWSDDYDYNNYTVYRAEASGSTKADYTAVASGVSSQSTTDAGLEAGERYYYRVVSVEDDTESPLSGEVSQTTGLPAPTLDSLLVAGDDLTLSWTEVDDSTDGDYLVEYSTDDGSTWVDSGTEPAGAESATDTDLQDETTYRYRVTRRTDHATAQSGTLEATTEDFTATQVGAQSLEIVWRNPDDITQDGYRVERRQDGVTDYMVVAEVGGDVESYTDGDVIPGTPYSYRVYALDGGSETRIASGSVTTQGGGGGSPRVGASGWSVSVTHPVSGRVIRPDVINPNQVQYLPGPNMMPEIRLPVRRAPSWLDAEFDDNPDMTVHLDGEELPIDELVNVEHEEGQTILIGEGGVELRKVVDVEYNAERRPVAATTLVDANTTYATVDNSPPPESDTEVVQDVSGETELGNVSEFGDSVPLEYTNGGIKPLQTCWTTEGENEDRQSGTGFQDDDSFSNGSALSMLDVGDYAEYDFTLEYALPAGELAVATRSISGGTSPVEVELTIDGPSASNHVISNNASFGSGTPAWDARTADGLGVLEPGEYTLRFEVTDTGDGWSIDVVAPYDTRYSYTFDDDVNTAGGYLDGPELYPPSVGAVFDPYESAFSIVGGSVTATVNDTSNNQALALSNDRGASYPISASNTTSVSGDFSSPGGTLQLKATLSRYSPSGAQSATPRFGYDAQRLDGYELSADIEFESLLIDQEFGDSLASVLNDITGSRYAWTYSIEDGTPTVTVDEPGNSVADRDPEISDAQITKRVTTYSSVRIKGSNLPVDSEPFQASTSYVDLARTDIVTGSEAVTDSSGTNYVKDVDYEMAYGSGEIRILSGGSMTAGQDYTISYDYGIQATHTVPSATGPTLVRTIPGVTSDRQAEQIAYVLAEVYPGVATPRYEGEIVVPRFSTTFDPLEGLQLADFELPDAARPLSIRGEPELTPLGLTLRLGSAPSLEESLRGISEQVSAISDRV